MTNIKLHFQFAIKLPRTPPTTPPIVVPIKGTTDPNAAPKVDPIVDATAYFAFFLTDYPSFYPLTTSATVPTANPAIANTVLLFKEDAIVFIKVYSAVYLTTLIKAFLPTVDATVWAE